MLDLLSIYYERLHDIRRARGQVVDAQVYRKIPLVVLHERLLFLLVDEVHLDVVVLRHDVYEVEIRVLDLEPQALRLRQSDISVFQLAFLELVEGDDIVSVFWKISGKLDFLLVFSLRLQLQEREERREVRLHLLYDKLRRMILKRLVVWIVLLQEIPDVIVVQELVRHCIVVLRLKPMLPDGVEDGVVEILREMAKIKKLFVSRVVSLDDVFLY